MIEIELRLKLINELAECIASLTDGEYAASLERIQDRCYDIWANDDYRLKDIK